HLQASREPLVRRVSSGERLGARVGLPLRRRHRLRSARYIFFDFGAVERETARHRVGFAAGVRDSGGGSMVSAVLRCVWLGLLCVVLLGCEFIAGYAGDDTAVAPAGSGAAGPTIDGCRVEFAIANQVDLPDSAPDPLDLSCPPGQACFDTDSDAR